MRRVVGVPRDDAAAVHWFGLAAARGDAGAQLSLGVMYAEGRGVAQDYARAMDWFPQVRGAGQRGGAGEHRTSVPGGVWCREGLRARVCLVRRGGGERIRDGSRAAGVGGRAAHPVPARAGAGGRPAGSGRRSEPEADAGGKRVSDGAAHTDRAWCGRGPNLDPAGEWFDGARRVASPNRDARPPGSGIDLIIVHGISLPPGEFGGPHIERLFCKPARSGRARLLPHHRRSEGIRPSPDPARRLARPVRRLLRSSLARGRIPLRRPRPLQRLLHRDRAGGYGLHAVRDRPVRTSE